MYEQFVKETGVDLMKEFDQSKLNNPVTDIVDVFTLQRQVLTMYKRGKVSNVFIEKNIVEKVFDYDVDKGYRGNGQQSYQREKEALLRLKGNKHLSNNKF